MPLVGSDVQHFADLSVPTVPLSSNGIDLVGRIVNFTTHVSPAIQHWLHLYCLHLGRIFQLVLSDTIRHFEAIPGFFLATDDKQAQVFGNHHSKLEHGNLQFLFCPAFKTVAHRNLATFNESDSRHEVVNLEVILRLQYRLPTLVLFFCGHLRNELFGFN